MKLCILSDSHDNRALMSAAVQDAKARGAVATLHCGDIVAANTLNIFKKLEMPAHVIYGNNTGDLYTLSRMAHESGNLIHFYGQDAGITLHGRTIFIVHYPHYARAMACTGEWDMVCCGHDHVAAVSTVENIRGGKTWMVNPGTVGGVGKPPTYILGDLDAMTFEVLPVPAIG